MSKFTSAIPATARSPEALALEAFRNRDYAAAAAAAQEAVARDPHNFQWHYLRGRALAAGKDYEPAIDCYRRAIECDASQPAAHISMGVVTRALGLPWQAAECHRRALALDPDSFEAHLNLGNALIDLRDFDAAASAFQSALTVNERSSGAWLGLAKAWEAMANATDARAGYARAKTVLHPHSTESLSALATLARTANRHADAARYLKRIAELNPQAAEPLVDFGLALQQAGELQDSVDAFERARALQPDNIAALVNLGVSLTELQRYDAAQSVLQRALEVDARCVEAHVDLSVAYYRGRRIEPSLAHCELAVEIEPRHAGALTGKGVILMERRELPAAIECFRGAIASDPVNAKAHTNLALALLMAGEMREGWSEYEWRWKTYITRGMNYPRFAQPQWRGEPLAGRRLLIHAEQGFGDTLQFVRYAQLAAAQGARVFVEVQRPLESLVRSMPGIEQVIAYGDSLPEFDLQCPMLSLPLAFDTTLDTIPGGIPYLAPGAKASKRWRKRLAAVRGMKVGLVWAGGARKHDINCDLVDQRRSMDLADLSALAQIECVRFVSLQIGTVPGEAARAAFGDRLLDWTADIGDFSDTAAIIDNLDLVIAVDTSVVHLAGAMGKRVWMLSRFDGCWRWLLDGDTTSWYPTMRIFRQPASGDWATPVARVSRALAEAAAGHAGAGSRT